MGKIKKLHFNEIIGGSSLGNEELYPVTSSLAVYRNDGSTMESSITDIEERLSTVELTGGGLGGSGTGYAINYIWIFKVASSQEEADNSIVRTTQGIPSGWSETSSLDIPSGKQLYFSLARALNNSYLTWATGTDKNMVWTSPVAIGSNTSLIGVDSDGMDFIYCRTTGSIPTLRTAVVTVENIKILESNQGIPMLSSVLLTTTLTNNAWYDHPQGVDSVYTHEWMAYATKSNGQWSVYKGPVLWAKYGEKGTDGDSVEYIFCLRQTLIANPSALINNDVANIASPTLNKQDDDFLPNNPLATSVLEQWFDNTQLVSESYPLQYVAIRKKKDGVWQNFETPTLWSRFGKDGDPGIVSGYILTNNNDTVILDDDTTSNTVIQAAANSLLSVYNTSGKTDYSVSYYLDTTSTSLSLFDITVNESTGTITYTLKASITKLTLGVYNTKVKAFIEDTEGPDTKPGTEASPVKGFMLSRQLTLLIKDFSTGEVYKLNVTPNSISATSTNKPKTNITINVSYLKIKGDNIDSYDLNYEDHQDTAADGDGLSWVPANNIFFKAYEVSSAGVSSIIENELEFSTSDTLPSYIVIELRKKIGDYSSIVIDSETINIATSGSNGTATIQPIVVKPIEYIFTSESGITNTATTVSTSIQLLNGASTVSINASMLTAGILTTGITASKTISADAKTINVSWTIPANTSLTNSKYIPNLSFTYGGKSYSLSFIVYTIKGTALNILNPSKSLVQFTLDRNGDYSPSSISVSLGWKKLEKVGSNTVETTYNNTLNNIKPTASSGNAPYHMGIKYNFTDGSYAPNNGRYYWGHDFFGTHSSNGTILIKPGTISATDEGFKSTTANGKTLASIEIVWMNGDWDNLQIYQSTIIPVLRDAKEGMTGAVVRMMGEFDKDTSYVNQSNSTASGIRYIDVVQYKVNDTTIKYYQRNTTTSGYSSTADTYGTTSGGIVIYGYPKPTNSTFWSEVPMHDSIATKLLIAENAWTQYLTGKTITCVNDNNQITAGINGRADANTPIIYSGSSYKDGAGTPPALASFRVYRDGTIYANGANFINSLVVTLFEASDTTGIFDISKSSHFYIYDTPEWEIPNTAILSFTAAEDRIFRNNVVEILICNNSLNSLTIVAYGNENVGITEYLLDVSSTSNNNKLFELVIIPAGVTATFLGCKYNNKICLWPKNIADICTATKGYSVCDSFMDEGRFLYFKTSKPIYEATVVIGTDSSNTENHVVSWAENAIVFPYTRSKLDAGAEHCINNTPTYFEELVLYGGGYGSDYIYQKTPALFITVPITIDPALIEATVTYVPFNNAIVEPEDALWEYARGKNFVLQGTAFVTHEDDVDMNPFTNIQSSSNWEVGYLFYGSPGQLAVKGTYKITLKFK